MEVYTNTSLGCTTSLLGHCKACTCLNMTVALAVFSCNRQCTKVLKAPMRGLFLQKKKDIVILDF